MVWIQIKKMWVLVSLCFIISATFSMLIDVWNVSILLYFEKICQRRRSKYNKALYLIIMPCVFIQVTSELIHEAEYLLSLSLSDYVMVSRFSPCIIAASALYIASIKCGNVECPWVSPKTQFALFIYFTILDTSSAQIQQPIRGRAGVLCYKTITVGIIFPVNIIF